MNGKPVNKLHAVYEQERQALLDKATAIKVLGGFGQRVHLGDMDYALKINEVLNALAFTNPEDVECAMIIMKVRTKGATPEEDRFHFVGGNYGTEPELTALHLLLAAEMRLFRATITKKLVEVSEAANPKEAIDAVQDEDDSSEGL